MSVRARTLIGALFALSAVAVAAQDLRLTYPQTARGEVAELQFGEKVADPYRWLENDVRTDSAVAQWVGQQNAVTQGYLAALPQRVWFGTRIKELMDYERFGLPQKAGANYFYMRNSGLQNQSQLFVRKGLGGAPRLLIDPNAWARDGATALADWVPSDNGKLLAYSIQDGGSDWRVIKLMDVSKGKVLTDEIKWAKFTGIAWVGNTGFLYSRFPEPKEGQAFQQPNTNQAVYFHAIGTPQSADQLVYATPDQPDLGHSAEVTHDGRWVVITTAKGTDNKYEVHVLRVSKGKRGQPEPLIVGLEHDWRLIDGMGDTLYFITNRGAPKLKVVKVEVGATPKTWTCPDENDDHNVCETYKHNFTDIIPERAETLERARIVGNRLILSYLKDAASTAEMVSLDGKPVRQITLNAIGTAAGFSGRPGDPETFYSFSSFNQPGAIYRFDSNTGVSTVFAQPKLAFNPADYAVEQRFYASKDGTKVPMFIVRKKGLVAEGKAAPTLLYGYGGFDISLTPAFSATRMAWLEAGGVFV
ncbi:MAG: S9 family peptidase, partial [Novosphingobium sp.]